MKQWWNSRNIIQKALIIFGIFTLFSMQRVSGIVFNNAGGKNAYFFFHIAGWCAFWLFMTYAQIKQASMDVQIASGSTAKWFKASFTVTCVLIVGFLFDYVAGTHLFVNVLSLIVAFGVLMWMYRRPPGGQAAPVNEGPRHANISDRTTMPTGTRPGMDKYADAAPRPPAAPRPASAPRPPAPRPPRDNEGGS